MSTSLRKLDWTHHLIELVFITLGILIAFGLNTWYGNRKDRQQANLYLQGLTLELLDNQRQLGELLPYQIDLMRRLESHPKETSLQLNTGYLNNVAWVSADHSILKQQVDQVLYTQLTRTYNLHNKLSQHIAFAIDQVHELNVMAPFYRVAAAPLTEEDQSQLSSELGLGWVPVFQDWTHYERMYQREICKSLALMESADGCQRGLDSIQAVDSLVWGP
ncbi:MAG TPA: hypothetical protein DCE41_33100 [Cytophagales bacterium]|nr:hypothetical protein [Cytophagales bacterium]HAA21319.1 hypothetical protein [Cytophagales bacterium]HAP63778.1 hypothetical protein [Cytophagales bacterium]